MSWYADATLSMEASDISSVLAGVSLVLTLTCIKDAKEESTQLALMNLAIDGMDVAAFGANIYDWTHGA